MAFYSAQDIQLPTKDKKMFDRNENSHKILLVLQNLFRSVGEKLRVGNKILVGEKKF